MDGLERGRTCLAKDFDIFVLASRWEGFGRVLVEAALAECPVISTRVVGTSEAMIDDETGLLVPPDDKECARQSDQRSPEG